MEKEIIKVPFGIKYISEWEDYSYPEGHCIVDKGVTGCGYTEYGLTNDKNVILCSPRKLLLENKAEKHKDDINILYLENNIKNFENSKDLEVSMADHIIKCRLNNLPIKFMITYDSAHYLIDYLVSKNLIDRFYIIADEFQSIFLDSLKMRILCGFLRCHVLYVEGDWQEIIFSLFKSAKMNVSRLRGQHALLVTVSFQK